MAFLLKQRKRPFWLLRYRGLSGRWVQKSTGLRIDSREDTRKARNLLENHRQMESDLRGGNAAELWRDWVPDFLRQRYGAPEQAKTLCRYETMWRNWRAFLQKQALERPRQMNYAQVAAFLEWRQAPAVEDGVRAASFNSALAELKFMGLLLDEAIRRGHCEKNPFRKLGLKKRKPKPKADYSPEDVQAVTIALKDAPDWMQASWIIALHQGCRLSAVQIDLSRDVNWSDGTLILHEKAQKIFTVPIHPKLRPILERWNEEGRVKACVLPRNASQKWKRFFGKIGRPHLTFHGLRVRFISALARAGVPLSKAMGLVGHSDQTVHKLYQRLTHSDLAGSIAILPGHGLADFDIFVPPSRGYPKREIPPLEMQTIYDED